jgi:hypothetical protein
MRIPPASAALGVLFTACLAAACFDDPAAPADPVASVGPARQWAGGTIEIVVRDLPPGGEDPVVLANGAAIPVEERDQNSAAGEGERIVVRLPETADGTLEIDVVTGDRTVRAGTVEAYGLAGVRLHPVRMDWMLRELPVGSGVSVVAPWGGNGRDPGGFSWIHLSTGTHRQFDIPHLFGICHGLGIIEDPPTLITCPGDEAPETVRWALVGGEAVRLGLGPAPPDTAGSAPSRTRSGSRSSRTGAGAGG